MADNKDYMIHEENMGTIQMSEDVVASIATTAALEVEGVGGLLNANMADFMGGKKMTAKGWYQTAQADQQQIAQVKQKYTLQ